MALTVGTDSYLSVADADTYWSDRNNSTWSAASEAEKEAALREATQYLDANYTWTGVLSVSDQVLDWPRFGAYDDEGRELSDIPTKVGQSCAELALAALSSRLVPVGSASGQETKKEKVGDIEVEYYEGSSTVGTYDFVDMLLSSFIEYDGTTIQLVRS